MLIIVGVLSLIPAPDMDIEGSDKIMHLLSYFVLSASFSVLIRYYRNLVVMAVGLIAYGILLEYLQSLTGYRYMEVYDALANNVGVIAGLLIRLTMIPEWFRRIEKKYLI